MGRLQEYQDQYTQWSGQRTLLEKQYATSCTKLLELEKHQRHLQEAQRIIQEVAQATQEELQYHVGEIVTLALAAVFDDPYELVLDFVLKRGQTEADILFKDTVSGKTVDPLSATGGGAIDVAVFALRAALWSLRTPAKRTRATLLLDEPFRNINDPTRELHKRTAKMVHSVCQKLSLQVIMVTTMPEMLDCADTCFTITKTKGISHVLT